MLVAAAVVLLAAVLVVAAAGGVLPAVVVGDVADRAVGGGGVQLADLPGDALEAGRAAFLRSTRDFC